MAPGKKGKSRDTSPTKGRAKTSMGFEPSNSPYSFPVSPGPGALARSPPRTRTGSPPPAGHGDSYPSAGHGAQQGENTSEGMRYFKRKDGTILCYKILSNRRSPSPRNRRSGRNSPISRSPSPTRRRSPEPARTPGQATAPAAPVVAGDGASEGVKTSLAKNALDLNEEQPVQSPTAPAPVQAVDTTTSIATVNLTEPTVGSSTSKADLNTEGPTGYTDSESDSDSNSDNNSDDVNHSAQSSDNSSASDADSDAEDDGGESLSGDTDGGEGSTTTTTATTTTTTPVPSQQRRTIPTTPPVGASSAQGVKKDKRASQAKKGPVNFVVIHDMFHTVEQLSAFFRPIMTSHPECNVLLWNCPGQQNTQIKSQTIANNDYAARCLHDLLWYLELNKSFYACSEEFYLVGLGRGANIALYFSIFFMTLPLRALILGNPYPGGDPHLTDIIHSWEEALSFAGKAWTSTTFMQIFAHLLVSPKHCVPSQYSTILKALNRPVKDLGRPHWIRFFQGLNNDVNITPVLRRLERPMIIVQSQHDLLVPPPLADSILALSQGKQAENLSDVLASREAVVHLRQVEGGHDILRHQQAVVELSDVIRQIASSHSPVPEGTKSLTRPNNLIDEIDKPDDEPIIINGLEIPEPE